MLSTHRFVWSLPVRLYILIQCTTLFECENFCHFSPGPLISHTWPITFPDFFFVTPNSFYFFVCCCLHIFYFIFPSQSKTNKKQHKIHFDCRPVIWAPQSLVKLWTKCRSSDKIGKVLFYFSFHFYVLRRLSTTSSQSFSFRIDCRRYYKYTDTGPGSVHRQCAARKRPAASLFSHVLYVSLDKLISETSRKEKDDKLSPFRATHRRSRGKRDEARAHLSWLLFFFLFQQQQPFLPSS